MHSPLAAYKAPSSPQCDTAGKYALDLQKHRNADAIHGAIRDTGNAIAVPHVSHRTSAMRYQLRAADLRICSSPKLVSHVSQRETGLFVHAKRHGGIPR